MLPLYLQSNNSLDAAYDLARRENRSADAAMYAAEIVDRLADVGSFVWGIAGGDEFPKYGAWAGYSQSDAARTSVSQNVGNVTSAVSSAADFAGGTVWKVLKPVAITAALIGLAAWLVKRKSKGKEK